MKHLLRYFLDLSKDVRELKIKWSNRKSKKVRPKVLTRYILIYFVYRLSLSCGIEKIRIYYLQLEMALRLEGKVAIVTGIKYVVTWVGSVRLSDKTTVEFLQWRKSVKIIGGDETEPSKVAHIKKRIVA